MKKKFLFMMVACFIAATSVLHFNFSQTDHNLDFSMADFAAMAQADPENGGGTLYCCEFSSDCKWEEEMLCVWCSTGKCVFIEDHTENCGLASTCTTP